MSLCPFWTDRPIYLDFVHCIIRFPEGTFSIENLACSTINYACVLVKRNNSVLRQLDANAVVSVQNYSDIPP